MIKKFLFVFSVVFLVVGCSSPDESYEDFVSRSFIGVIQEAQVPLEGLNDIYALSTDASSVIYLQSFVHDLSSFVDTRVKVTGDFKVLDLANNNVDFLMVNTIDSLDAAKITLEEDKLEIYDFPNLAIKFPATAALEIKESEDSIFFSLDSTNFLVSRRQLNSSGYELYLKTYQNVPSDLLLIAGSSFNVFFNSEYEQLYVTQVGDFVLEIKVSLFESSKQSTIDDFLSSLMILKFAVDEEINELPDDILESLNTPAEKVTDAQNSEEVSTLESMQLAPIISSSEDVTVDEQLQTKLDSSLSGPASLSGVNSDYTSKLVIGSQPYLENVTLNANIDSPYSSVISRFSVLAKDLLPFYSSSLEFAFTESNYFYIIYLDVSSNKQRALFSYSDKAFNLQAEFEEGTVMDWKLVSGDNPVYDQSLTVFSIDPQNSNFTIHSLREGFRLFESLPLEFSLHYPKDWFYKREANSYIFSDSSEMLSVLLTVELLNSFDPLAFSKISPDLFFNGGTYVRAISDGKFLRISANNLDLLTLEYIVNSTREL
jgi:hypothetical protein